METVREQKPKLLDQLRWAIKGEALLSLYRKDLRPMGQEVYLFSQKAPSALNGSRRGTVLSELPGCGAEGIGFHPEPGLERACVSL